MDRDGIKVIIRKIEWNSSRISVLKKILSPDEVERADKFKLESLHHNYVFCRATLRCFLADRTGQKPEEVRFDYNPNGKPHLTGENSNSLHFNISHSGDLAAFAISTKNPIGIDLERIKENLDYVTMAKRFFSKNEQEAIFSLPEKNQKEAFYRCWTRREAYIKGRGSATSLMIDKIEMAVEPGVTKALRKSELHPEDLSHWVFEDVKVGVWGVKGKYVSSLAIKT